MRRLGDDIRSADRRITATTRQLESMIRLSEAHARMRLSEEVVVGDVEEAVRLIRSAIKQAATDARTGLIDMSLLSEGTTAVDRRLREDLKKAILAAIERHHGGGGGRWSDILREMSANSGTPIDTKEFAEVVRALEMENLVTVTGDGARRTIRRNAAVVA